MGHAQGASPRQGPAQPVLLWAMFSLLILLPHQVFVHRGGVQQHVLHLQPARAQLDIQLVKVRLHLEVPAEVALEHEFQEALERPVRGGAQHGGGLHLS